MHIRQKVAISVIAGSLGLAVGLSPSSPVHAVLPGGPVLALRVGNELVRFDAANPTVTTSTTITGLVAGESVVGIDVRPSTGVLYAVGVSGTSGHIYTIDTSTGVATVVNATAFSTTLPTGGTWSVDFNPVADRIRFVHSTGVSYRLNQNDGTLAATDTAVAPAQATAVAYDRSTVPAPTATTLFAIDGVADTLNLIGGANGTPSPNTGATTLVGALGVPAVVDGAPVGFDIAATGDAYATLDVAGSYGLYTINLATGAATAVGAVESGAVPVLDIVLPRTPSGPMIALGTANALHRFDAATPSAVTTVTITGLQPAETIVGLDVRPATGEVIGVGVAGTSGRLYRINATTGVATQIGTTPFSTGLPAGGTWAVDFNPTVDLIRFVHSSGANYRLSPVTGALAGTDTSITLSKPSAVAYDRPIATTAATTLYSIDDAANTLNRIGGPNGTPSPNGGASTPVGLLGFDATERVGFDITPTGQALASLNVANVTGLYTIDLVTGAAALVGPIATGTADILDLAALPNLPGGAAQFTPVAPTRLLDTRTGGGTKPAANAIIDLQVTGVAGVPADATAIVLNTTGTDVTVDGYVTVYPTGEPRPLASNNNLATGVSKASLATTKIGAGGKVSIYVQNGANIVVDVLGYYAPATSTAGRFVPLPIDRLVDTREGTNTKLGVNGTIDVQVTGRKGVPTSGVSAVVVDLTGTDATIGGYVTAYAKGTTRPGTSNLNLERIGGTVSNLAIVPVGADGQITVFSQNGAHIVVDVAGYYTDATSKGGYSGLFVPVSPSRILDTREGVGAPKAALAQQAQIDLTVAGVGGVPAVGASGVTLNVTSVDAVAPGFVTVFPTGATRPFAASLNVDVAGQIVPNLVATPLGAGGKVTIFDHAGGNLVADVAGWFTS